VRREPPRSNRRGYVKPNYRDKKGWVTNPRNIKQRDSTDDKEAFMDMGLNNLFAVVTTDGSAMLVRGGSIKSKYYRWKREIAIYYKRHTKKAWHINTDLPS
jgi:transposase